MMRERAEEHKKVWGAEYWIINRNYCGKKLILNRQFECSMHYHRDKDETFYLESGLVLIRIDNYKRLLLPGDLVRIPSGTPHQFIGLEHSEIFEFSTKHKESDSFRSTQSRRIPDEEFMEIQEEARAIE